jgi:hypothetical protein
MPTFDPSQFGIQTLDFRVIGAVLSGGKSLSGIEDPISTDGGGFVVADFSGGQLIDRESNLAWRALMAACDNGIASVDVLLCDRRHQPVRKNGPAISAAAVSSPALRATSITISASLNRSLLGGEWFSINHPTWGHRAYQIATVTPSGSNFVLTFRPPLREAVSSGTAIEFSYPTCKMRLASAPSNSTTGRLGTAAASFVEDMRLPS